jgi:transglutaminase-like putative cysteine protease
MRQPSVVNHETGDFRSFAQFPQPRSATEAGNATTHAWAEVYLPGPGWKGFDPTAGEVTSSRHIPVAVARHPEAVPPVAGSFIGPAEPMPTLTVAVRVTAL